MTRTYVILSCFVNHRNAGLAEKCEVPIQTVGGVSGTIQVPEHLEIWNISMSCCSHNKAAKNACFSGASVIFKLRVGKNGSKNIHTWQQLNSSTATSISSRGGYQCKWVSLLHYYQNSEKYIVMCDKSLCTTGCGCHNFCFFQKCHLVKWSVTRPAKEKSRLLVN